MFSNPTTFFETNKAPSSPRLPCHYSYLSTHFRSYFMQFPWTLHQQHGCNTQFNIKKLNLVQPAHTSQMIIPLFCIQILFLLYQYCAFSFIFGLLSSSIMIFFPIRSLSVSLSDHNISSYYL